MIEEFVVIGAEDGEAYGAIVWRMMELFGPARRDELFAYIVDGMNYTPSGPTVEEMRDGILQSIANGGNAPDACLVWKAFAKFGVGVGAKAVVRGKTVTTTESMAVPAGC